MNLGPGATCNPPGLSLPLKRVSLLYSREKPGRKMLNNDSQMSLILLRRVSGEVVKEAEKEAFTTVSSVAALLSVVVTEKLGEF